MKKLLTLFLILTTALAVTITTTRNINIDREADLGVHVNGGIVGKLLTAKWSNEKVHVFPGQYILESSDQQFAFKLIVEEGACGQTDITFSTTGSDGTIASLMLPNCTVMTEEYPFSDLPVERDFREFEMKRLNTAEKYLQIGQNLRNALSQFHSFVEQAKQTSDFNEKTALADSATLILKSIKTTVPYIVEKNFGSAIIGTQDLKSEVESRFGKVSESNVLMYKRFSHAEAQSGGTTANPVIRDFTLFSIHLYNPLNENSNIYLIEDEQAENWSEDPAYVGGVTIWELTLTPGETRTVSYEVDKLVELPITTRVYHKIETPAEPENLYEPEPEPEQPSDLLGQIISFFGNMENFLKNLLP